MKITKRELISKAIDAMFAAFDVVDRSCESNVEVSDTEWNAIYVWLEWRAIDVCAYFDIFDLETSIEKVAEGDYAGFYKVTVMDDEEDA
jgi:hypothetical protein